MPQRQSGRSIVTATFRELAEPSDVLLWAVRHERVNTQGVLWVGDALQTPIGMAGAIHLSMAAVDKNNAIGLTAPGTEVLQQVEETAITPPRNQPVPSADAVEVTVSPTPASKGIRSGGIRSFTNANNPSGSRGAVLTLNASPRGASPQRRWMC